MKIKFKKRGKDGLDQERRFEAVYALVKVLPRADFSKFIDGIKLAWEGHEKALRVQTRDEREADDIDEIEKNLSKEAK